MKPIVVLSGPVGAGKTTVARALVAAAPGPLVYIEGDTFWSFIANDTGIRRQRTFRAIMSAMTAAAVPYALANFEVLLDFSIPPWYLERVQALVQRREIALEYVVLRPSERVCAARAAARTEGAIADYVPYHDLYASFDAAERHILQDDESPVPIIAAQIRAGLETGRFRLGTSGVR